MNILTIDTSLGITSLVIANENQIIAQFVNTQRNAQATNLVRWIEQLLVKAKFEYQDIDMIATSVGPGGFTGIRIGLSVARMIAHLLDREIIGFSNLSLMSMAFADSIAKPHISLIPSGRDKYFAQKFTKSGEPSDDARLVEELKLERYIGNIDTIITCGNLPQFLSIEHIYQYNIENSAKILYHLSINNRKDSLTPYALYIRGVDAKVSVKS